MRIANNVIIAVAAGVLVLLLSCGKKTVETPAIIIGTDTLMIGRIAVYDPAGSSDSVRLRNVAVRLLYAGALPDSSGDSLVRGCTERLSLVSGIEWDPLATALLLRAARRLIEQAGSPQPCAAVEQFSDSVRQLLTKVIVAPAAASPLPPFSCASVDLLQRRGRVWLTGSVLGVSPEVAALLVEFVATPAPQDAGADSAALKNLIAGLVSPSASIQADSQLQKQGVRQTPVRKPPLEQPDNSAEALRYRNQQSIRDSIEKHIPNLKQLYKKNLKINSSLAGKVIVNMRVAAGGAVIGVTIKGSEIRSKAFLGPFVAYLHTIRFKPIPEKVGAMTFDFPFEFNPEM